MVVPLFAGNLQHPSSKFVSRYGHLKTISERCKNHTPTTSMCNHPHSSLADETAITATYRRSCAGEGWVARWWLPPWKIACSGRASLGASCSSATAYQTQVELLRRAPVRVLKT